MKSLRKFVFLKKTHKIVSIISNIATKAKKLLRILKEDAKMENLLKNGIVCNKFIINKL
jgi:hypothetical protein